jgi:mono/diheme cytochrome c family protein
MKLLLRNTLAALWLTAGPLQADPQLAPGEYPTRAGDCISCHTVPGGEPYAGGLTMTTPFGDLITPNITPDAETGIGTWTADDFHRALTQGVGKHGEDLYPAFPYTFYTKITRADSDAIYRYLQSLAPVSNRVEVNRLRFPFSVRLSMIVWRELYFKPGVYRPSPEQSEEWNRGAYLVEGLGHCAACHSPRNALGAMEHDYGWTGARVGEWFALNLGSDLRRGIGDWSIEQVAEFLKQGAAKGKATAVGPMRQVVHNSLRYLTDADLRAMAVYLKSLPAVADAPAKDGASMDAEAVDEGAYIYLEHCAACHRAKGAGKPGSFPPLNGNPMVNSDDPADLIDVVLQGIPASDGYAPMPGFEEALGNREVADLLNYIRTAWGNRAAPNVTLGMVQRHR